MKSKFFSETSVDVCRSTQLKFSEELNFNYCSLANEKCKSQAVMTFCTRVIFSSGVSIFLTLELKLQNSVPERRILRYWNSCFWENKVFCYKLQSNRRHLSSDHRQTSRLDFYFAVIKTGEVLRVNVTVFMELLTLYSNKWNIFVLLL